MHPYDIEDLFGKYDIDKNKKTVIYDDGTFKLSDFMKELSWRMLCLLHIML